MLSDVDAAALSAALGERRRPATAESPRRCGHVERASTRVYIDDEHGSSSNPSWCKLIRQHGGDLERQANDAIPKKQLATTRSITAATTKLDGLDGLSASKFAEVANAIMGYNTAQGLVPGR